MPPASFRKLNAAPVLCASTRLNTPSTGKLSPIAKWLVIHALLSWSSTITDALKPSQRLSIFPHLAATIQIAHTATAQRSMVGIAADILAVMPAAITLGMGAGRSHDALLSFSRNAMHGGARSDEN